MNPEWKSDLLYTLLDSKFDATYRNYAEPIKQNQREFEKPVW